MTTAAQPLVRIRGLRKSFPILSGILMRRKVGETVAVDNLDLDIHAGEVVGCVGETGSGKSTLGRLILSLLPPDGGEVRLDGTRIDNLPPARLRRHRRDMQIVFQDPLQALNPRRTVAENIATPLVNFGEPAARIAERVAELLALVGLSAAHANRYPHEFSGGQCQRIGIARALALNPRFLFLDEPVSALDASVQAQILNLLMDLRRKLDLTYLFVTHDLKIVRHFADRIVVLYHGRIVETGRTADLYAAPKHPYTRALLDSILRVEASDRWEAVAVRMRDAETEDAALGPAGSKGCIYARVCPERLGPCRTVTPTLADLGGGHAVACHLHDRTLTESGSLPPPPDRDARAH